MKNESPIEAVYNFTVTGSIIVPANFEPQLDSFGQICGLKSGNDVFRLIVAIEKENEGGLTFEHLTTDSQLQEKGMQIYDYDDSSFTVDDEKTIVYDSGNRGLPLWQVWALANENAKATGETIPERASIEYDREWATDGEGKYNDDQVASLYDVPVTHLYYPFK